METLIKKQEESHDEKIRSGVEEVIKKRFNAALLLEKDKEELPNDFPSMIAEYVELITRELRDLKLSSDEAFSSLLALCDPELGWNLNENVEVKNFLRKKAKEKVDDFIAGRRYLYKTSAKQAALEMAEYYAGLGILNLDTDHDLFNELTK